MYVYVYCYYYRELPPVSITTDKALPSSKNFREDVLKCDMYTPDGKDSFIVLNTCSLHSSINVHVHVYRISLNKAPFYLIFCDFSSVKQ